MIHVGTAAWAVPQNYRDLFPGPGTLLERYARVLPAVEINTSFYRDHMESTYQKWRESTPPHFRFSVKLSKMITHELKLECSSEEIALKLQPISRLGEKWGVLLVQLPPSLTFQRDLAMDFFSNLREVSDVPVAFEPRHPSWATMPAKKILQNFRISKVLADPDPCETPDWQDFLNDGLVYHRLHGSPVRFRSLYQEKFIRNLCELIASEKKSFPSIWCMFDNTAYGHATYNALEVLQSISPKSSKFQLNRLSDFS